MNGKEETRRDGRYDGRLVFEDILNTNILKALLREMLESIKSNSVRVRRRILSVTGKIWSGPRDECGFQPELTYRNEIEAI